MEYLFNKTNPSAHRESDYKTFIQIINGEKDVTPSDIQMAILILKNRDLQPYIASLRGNHIFTILMIGSFDLFKAFVDWDPSSILRNFPLDVVISYIGRNPSQFNDYVKMIQYMRPYLNRSGRRVYRTFFSIYNGNKKIRDKDIIGNDDSIFGLIMITIISHHLPYIPELINIYITSEEEEGNIDMDRLAEYTTHIIDALTASDNIIPPELIQVIYNKLINYHTISSDKRIQLIDYLRDKLISSGRLELAQMV